MWRRLVWLAVVGCGRFDFNGSSDAGGGPPKPADRDGASALIDAGALVDVPPGSGTYALGDTTSTYVALAGGTMLFGVGADEATAPLALPFPFPFYDVMFSTVTVSVNGFVTFDAAPSGTESYLNDCPIDATPPDAAIYVFWDDLFVTTGGAVTYLAAGTSPNRTIAIEWHNMSAWYAFHNGSYDQQMSTTQQLVLHENGAIDLWYGPRAAPLWNYDCGLDRHRGCSATVGIEASGSTQNHLVQCGTAAGTMAGYTPIDPDRLITFTPM